MASAGSLLKKLTGEQAEAQVSLDDYARTFPDVPGRFVEIVGWLEKNLRESGYAFSVERLTAVQDENAQRLAETHGFTPAETRLVLHVLNGGTVGAYAKSNGLSRHTVRNQLQSAYCKTGTHRQAELVSLLLKA